MGERSSGILELDTGGEGTKSFIHSFIHPENVDICASQKPCFVMVNWPDSGRKGRKRKAPAAEDLWLSLSPPRGWQGSAVDARQTDLGQSSGSAPL